MTNSETAAVEPLVPRDPAGVALPGERRVLAAAERSLRHERRGLRGVWPFLGPAFVAAIAYVDPGNFATNVAAGSKYGYLHLSISAIYDGAFVALGPPHQGQLLNGSDETFPDHELNLKVVSPGTGAGACCPRFQQTRAGHAKTCAVRREAYRRPRNDSAAE